MVLNLQENKKLKKTPDNPNPHFLVVSKFEKGEHQTTVENYGSI